MLQKSLLSWKCLDRLPAEHTMITCSVFIQKAHPPHEKSAPGSKHCNHATLVSKGLSSQPIIRVTNVSSEARTDSNIGVTIVIVSLIMAQERQKNKAITISTEANISWSPRLQDKSQLRIFGSRPPSLFLRASLSRPKADLTPLRPFVTWWFACSKSPKKIPNAPKVPKKSQKSPKMQLPTNICHRCHCCWFNRLVIFPSSSVVLSHVTA